jgi:transcription termination factor Rho
MSQPEPPEDAQISQPIELPLEMNDAPPKAEAEAYPASDPEPTSEPATESKSESREPAKDPQSAEPAKDEKPETSKKDTKEVNKEKEEAPRDKPKPAEDSDSDESGNKPKSKGSESGDEEDSGEKRERRRRRSRSRNRRRRRDDNKNDSDSDSESRDGEADEENDEGEDGKPRKTRKQRYLERKEKERAKEAAALEAAEPVDTEGIVEISPKGFGFLRERKNGFQQTPSDVFITPEVVRIYGLRDGLLVKCISKQGLRGPQLVELQQINGKDPEEYKNLPYFEELTAINPDKKLTLETSPTRTTTRVIDLMAPIGRGQRGLIVAPPRTGKTTLLHHIAEGLQENYDEEMHLMVLLVDERPEEVTDFKRSFPEVEVFSSSNDSDGKEHTRISLLAIERAKRLVEAGEHVFILMDSITRLARAFNSQMRGGKRGTASGGLIVGALETPRRIFAAARNTREAGSLTIIATALIQTNSKADEAIFQEFKGTGNMELVLDRQIAQNYVYPAVDIHKSGTRREELLLPPHNLEKIHVIRRGLSGYKPIDTMEWLLKCLERYPSNAQMLMEMKTGVLS